MYASLPALITLPDRHPVHRLLADALNFACMPLCSLMTALTAGRTPALFRLPRASSCTLIDPHPIYPPVAGALPLQSHYLTLLGDFAP